MRAFWVAVLFSVTSVLVAQRSQQSEGQKSSEEWFLRANDRMMLRLPGESPFHMHATFHANPGEEFLARNEKSNIIVGDGTYDEVWVDIHRWRREVKLGDYTAVETEMNGARRFRASGDYEPGRVMMLLDALYNPVPRVFLEKETHEGEGWKIEEVTSGPLSLVRLGKSVGNQRTEYTDSYYFMPASGVLAMSNCRGLSTVWSSDITFNGKMIPTSLSIRAGERELLKATISVAPAQDSDLAQIDLPGPPADPGRTLRPLHPDNIRVPDLTSSFRYISTQLGPAPALSMTGVLDRSGHYREVEALVAPDRKNAAAIISHFRTGHEKSATIDGDACQFRLLLSLF